MESKEIDKMQKHCGHVASTLKALSHPQRLMILCFLSKKEQTVGELQDLCQISQSNVSQFLNRMKREGLVGSRREANFMYYNICDANISSLIKSLNHIYCSGDTQDEIKPDDKQQSNETVS